MTNFIKEHYKNVKVTNADFITKNYDNNDFSLIFCNPPFSFGNNKTFYTDFFAKMQEEMRKENPLDSEILATLKDISRTNAAAAGSSEKMLRYTQN